MATVPELTKREYDERLFSVDVSPKLRESDTVSSFDSVAAERFAGPQSPTELAVEVASTPITDSKILNFTCGEGQAGATYTVALRYTPGTETQLESIVRVKVV